MSVPNLVQAFYSRVWNQGEVEAASELLSGEFRFRGSLGAEGLDAAGFREYVKLVRGALRDYRCDIIDCVTEGNKAFAKMQFSGIHAAHFRGYAPTGKPVHWLGAALFHFKENRIAELWVLGDLDGLEKLLQANAGR
jgi:steroid delta-isomerase-like uncharacterized protein